MAASDVAISKANNLKMTFKHEPIKAILVDLDGVLRIWPDGTDLVEESHGLPRGAIGRIAFAAPQLMPAISGISTDADWRRSIVRELLRAHPQSDADKAVSLWSKSAGELNVLAIRALSKYEAKVKLVLATNATSRLRNDLDALGIRGLFSGIANSSEMGVVKPEPAFYRAALEIAESHADQTIYIDDIAENVEAALKMGIRSHRFIDIDGMETFLSQCIRESE